MPKISAGLLMYRRNAAGGLEVLLVHPGGPFWKNKDAGAWTFPRGAIEEGEDLFTGALREYTEETGLQPREPYIPLGSVKQRSGKQVHAWAFEGDCDPGLIRSNTFEIEWPPKSGTLKTFPEIDRAAFFPIAEAKQKILAVEIAFLDRLEGHLSIGH